MLLDAIGRSDGTRDSVVESSSPRGSQRAAGTFGSSHGDITETPVTVLRVRRRRVEERREHEGAEVERMCVRRRASSRSRARRADAPTRRAKFDGSVSTTGYAKAMVDDTVKRLSHFDPYAIAKPA